MAEKPKTKTKSETKASSSASQTETKPNLAEEKKKGAGPIVIILLLVVALVGAGLFFANRESAEDESPSEVTENPLLPEDLNDPVATVNGEPVSLKMYGDRVQDFANNVAFQGLDLEDETVRQQIREQALAALINTEILLQKADEAGVTVSDEDVEAAVSRASENFGGGDGLAEALTELGFSEEDLREDIRGQLLIDAYLQAELDLDSITVTEEEISDFYTEATSGVADAEPLEEVSELIREQLTIQKQQALLNELIESLRAEANIEILI